MSKKLRIVAICGPIGSPVDNFVSDFLPLLKIREKKIVWFAERDYVDVFSGILIQPGLIIRH